MIKGTGKLAILFFIGAMVIGAYFYGFKVGKSEARIVPIEGVKNAEVGQPEAVDFSLFWDTWGILQEKYAKAESFDYQKMVYGAISGMVDSLEDPYTVFMEPEDSRRFQDDISGSFEGVGMEVGIRDRQLQIIAPLEGTPAKKAGLRSGDIIVKIDDSPTRSLSLDEAVSLIRGPRGTNVTLAILRDDWTETKDIVVTRATIKIVSVKWEIRKDNIAYVQLIHFSEDASGTFSAAATGILASSADRIILDLRNNPGGFLEVAVDIAGWFLERDQVVVIEDFGEEGSEVIYKAKGNGKLGSYPVIILMNQGSASASEILAGALRDHSAVALVGEKSFGKGSVQELENLTGGGALKVTVANWLTPNGDHITDIGLEPDVQVEMTPEDFASELDPQLDKALELIRDL
ncbi:MAG: S41 family peptidase [bacterium]|nr:S41 family peptidase [bacterium]